VVNIARLLQTLDQDGNPDNGITITELARKTLSGFHSLDFDQSPENFSDDPDLKQLMNKLNDAGVFGAEKRTLQDVDTALKHLKKTLQEHPIIVLKAPNGGEELMAGDDCEITWKATSSITNVAILVSTDGGESWNEPPITDSTPNDGSYVWPSVSAFAGSDCRIKVADTSTDVYDESDSDFAVVAAALPPPEAPRIEVSSPNGGEILQAGSSFEITWAAAGVEQVKIELSADAGKTYTEIATTGAPAGAFIWQLNPQESSATSAASRFPMLRI
jgi:hypothetical protein